jgi:type I restriction enzyme M protein
MTILENILKDSIYRLTQFSAEQVKKAEKNAQSRGANGKGPYYINCPVRKKEVKLTPEEVVRQLYLDTLMTGYGYDAANFDIQSEVTMGSSGKRADIVVCAMRPKLVRKYNGKIK